MPLFLSSVSGPDQQHDARITGTPKTQRVRIVSLLFCRHRPDCYNQIWNVNIPAFEKIRHIEE
jgi:hypothetical protein